MENKAESGSASTAGPRPLLAALNKIAYHAVACRCHHDDENCCVKVGEHCPVCIAAVAITDFAAAPVEDTKEKV